MKAWKTVAALVLAAALAGCGTANTGMAPAPGAAAPTMALPTSSDGTPTAMAGDAISADQSAAIGHDATTSTQRADDSDGAPLVGQGGGGGEVVGEVPATEEWGGDGAETSDAEIEAELAREEARNAE